MCYSVLFCFVRLYIIHLHGVIHGRVRLCELLFFSVVGRRGGREGGRLMAHVCICVDRLYCTGIGIGIGVAYSESTSLSIPPISSRT